jgi:hypothetical protein
LTSRDILKKQNFNPAHQWVRTHVHGNFFTIKTTLVMEMIAVLILALWLIISLFRFGERGTDRSRRLQNGRSHGGNLVDYDDYDDEPDDRYGRRRQQRPVVIIVGGNDREERPRGASPVALFMLLFISVAAFALVMKNRDLILDKKADPSLPPGIEVVGGTSKSGSKQPEKPTNAERYEPIPPSDKNGIEQETPATRPQTYSIVDVTRFRLRKSHAVRLQAYTSAEGVYYLQGMYPDERIEVLKISNLEYWACLLANDEDRAYEKKMRFLRDHKDANSRGLAPQVLPLSNYCDYGFVRTEGSEVWFCNE